MTDKGRSYKQNKRVLRHGKKEAFVNEHSAEMSIHPSNIKHSKGNVHITRKSVVNGFSNIDSEHEDVL